MRLDLPVEGTPVPVTTSDEVLYRNTRFEFEVLDHNETIKTELVGVTGGSLAWSASASIKGSGTIDLIDTGAKINWMNSRVRVRMVLDEGRGKPAVKTVPIGVFIPSAPSSSWSDGVRTYTLEVLDKLSLLDGDTKTIGNGNAVTWTIRKGVNIFNVIIPLIRDLGESANAIQFDDDANLSSDMVFPAGTTSLKVVNELLAAANYFSLWCDGRGQYRATKYRRPADRDVVYEMEAHFTEGDNSFMGIDWTHDHDIYDVPNRYVAIQTGDGEDEGLTATAVDQSRSSPFSYYSRGRWITEVEEGVEAVDQAALNAYAQRKLDERQNVSEKVEISHVFLPDVLVNAVVKFKAGDVNMRASVQNTEIPLDPLELCKSTLKGVVGDNADSDLPDEGEL